MSILSNSRRKFKHRLNTVRRSYEPDYDHDAWDFGGAPTPATVPDAFYVRTEPVHPRTPDPTTRRQPHRSLTTAMLRRRLYGAGVRGAEAKRILAEILAGEQTESGIQYPMSWTASGFRQRFGRRVARAVLRFVHLLFIMIDEGWRLLNANTEFITNTMRLGRKYSIARPLVAEQTLPVPVDRTRRVSFQR